MANLNKCMFIGNLTRDPEMKTTPSGIKIANCAIAVNERWKDKQTGEKKEKAEFVNLTFFNRLAEIAVEYLKKGAQIYIEGKMQTDKWQDKDGKDRYTTKIIVSEMQMLGGGKAGDEKPVATNPAPTDDFGDGSPF